MRRESDGTPEPGGFTVSSIKPAPITFSIHLENGFSYFDHKDSVRARSGGCVDEDFIALAASHYAPADRGIHGQLAIGYVGFPWANHLEPVDLARFQVFYGYRSPETHLFEKELASDHYFTTGEFFFQIVDPFLEADMAFPR
jgi:hypothetical protein